MSAMNSTLGGFRAALVAGWLALGAAGLIYARVREIPAWAAIPLLAAFLLEYTFYLAAGFEAARERLARPWLLAASMALPYLAYSLGTGTFHWMAAAKLAALAAVLAWWFVVLPASALTDLAYLCLLAAVKLGHYLDPVYQAPVPRVDVDVLGFLAMVHVAAVAFLGQRRVPGVGFGFWPAWREWRIGAVYFLLFLPVGLPLALGLGAFQPGPPAPVWRIAATFVGVLWVVALAEEFLFRGLLQQWIERWTGSAAAALALASVAFGLVHLPFRAFPNWKMAVVAAVAGCFYGLAYRRAGSIRASMVSHALMVSLWRGFFV